MQSIANFPTVDEMRICNGLQSIVVGGFFSLVEKVLRVAACVLCSFKSLTASLIHQAKKIHVMYVANNFANLSLSPLPRLTYAKNLCRRDVVRNEEDVQATKARRELFLAKQNEPEIVAKVQNMKIKGAKQGGVCFGASLCFIKAYLDARVTSVEELQRLAKQYEEGFGAEASALQALHGKTVGWFPELTDKQAEELQAVLASELKKIKDEMAGKKKALMQQATQMTDIELCLKANALTKELDDRLTHLTLQLKNAKLFQHVMQNLEALATLTGLHLKSGFDRLEEVEFHQFDTDEATQKRFEQLPEGAYQLLFHTSEGGHAIAYVKACIGCFLFDPNLGLMPANSAQDLKKLFEKYPMSKPRHLEVYSYVTSTKPSSW